MVTWKKLKQSAWSWKKILQIVEFNAHPTDDLDFIKCNYCRAKFVDSSNVNGVFAMARHLKYSHIGQLREW